MSPQAKDILQKEHRAVLDDFHRHVADAPRTDTHPKLPADLKGEVCAVYDQTCRSDREAMRKWLANELPRHPFFIGMPGRSQKVNAQLGK
jgi:hypothetical protein